MQVTGDDGIGCPGQHEPNAELEPVMGDPFDPRYCFAQKMRVNPASTGSDLPQSTQSKPLAKATSRASHPITSRRLAEELIGIHIVQCTREVKLSQTAGPG